MASKGTKEKMKQIEKTVDKYREQRERAKREGDYETLQRLPRSASPTRHRRICSLTGRTRGNYRKFKMSRIMLRKLALEGKVPGMRKASW